MSALHLHRNFQAYRHNGDDKLLASLGLKVHGHVEQGAKDNWIDLGTVEVEPAREEKGGQPEKLIRYPACTVKVEVACYPAQFWRFTVERYHSRITGDLYGAGDWSVALKRETITLKTGSGGFNGYWPIAERFAQNMLDVEVKKGGRIRVAAH